jgi:hypothetical protein
MIFIEKGRGLSEVCKIMCVSTNIFFVFLASSNISKDQFQKESYHLLFSFPFEIAH